MKIISTIMKGFINLYRYGISPFFPCHCRYIPTCSEYAIQACQKHHFVKASYLILKRILRCNPLTKGGYDPVPTNKIDISN